MAEVRLDVGGQPLAVFVCHWKSKLGDPEKTTISLGGGKQHGDKLIDMTYDLLTGKQVEKDQYMPITVIDKTKAAARATDDFVHDEPWKAVGVAAALGLALGVLIGRR